ncbi:MAG TPA: SET domain-containing protein-lysine N-methyltransferase [Verrucomicrobiae bacterium]|nr:SET domain-containing protein-lysine N-methyltransferase [Verrucomicrobiae bacterium]
MNSTQPPATTPAESGDSKHSLVRFTYSSIHGTGGFARCDIPAGTRVIEYVGERIDKAEARRRCEADNRYIFYLNEAWDIDGDVPWNPARFLNHSCVPNCESELDEDAGRVWIIALRDIKAGEELSFNYGYDLADYLDHPCRCGAPGCVGYIVSEEHFDHVRSRAAKKAN